jgi:C4-dicarboxylate-specific signal transduction histidine kinase
MLETNNDITERRRAEDALRRIQETYLAEAQQLSHTGSFGWNVPTGELFLSKEGVRIFDFGSDARPSLEMMLARTHPEDMNLVRGVADRAAKERRDFDLEYRLLMPDSTVKYIHVVARAIPIDSSGVDLIGAVMDVTVIRRAQAELHKTRSELTHLMRVATVGELTASIAHEINQSLGAVVANAEASLGWLDRENPDLHEAQVAIERIVTDGHRAGKVIKRIRALVKKTDTQMAPVKLNELVSETVDLVRHELLSNHVMLEAELATEALVVLGDKIQLQQVLLNMIMNGIEAMQPIKDRPRELIVRSENVSAQQAQITVKDCGIGIPVESAQRIFEAFMTTKATGMGMGLSICRSIIEAHAGSIWASPSEPHGAAVQFTIPLHRSIVS